jgi:hypothetical protein
MVAVAILAAVVLHFRQSVRDVTAPNAFAVDSDAVHLPGTSNSESKSGKLPAAANGASPLANQEEARTDENAVPDRSPPTPVGEQKSAGTTHDADQAATKWELLDTSAAVGRPFPLSPSVTRACASSVPERSECPQLMEFLREFQREPRDLTWARQVERGLDEMLSTPNLDNARLENFHVRAIECRSTRCVIEVAALDDPFVTSIDDPQLKKFLYGPVVGDLGFEKDAGGRKVVVTVAAFRRN